MISPKFASTHYYHSARTLASGKSFTPHVINLYLDYNCPFSAKLFLKLKPQVIPRLQELHPNQFQFVFVNVVQPWHTNSNLLNEFSLVVAKLLRESTEKAIDTNKVFWDVSEVLFENKELFYDTANVNLNRNEIYKQIADLVFEKLSLPFSKDAVLKELTIKSETEKEKQSNSGNGATVDLKYFTRYLRNVGVHVTPTVSINNIVNDSISSGNDVDSLIKTFESQLD
ncbi:uncharacterized protein AC631_05625 [Debaryomyces fabryi]|uniref:Uncharacterized protein n=1 Tax=Debaryomyces fabryi TaxID=58627 RepID=A0A0V1PQU4_9ASCO|nr:uncharacterized protein AC631_05625 [Debaryomyces fabryi]KRZ98620.1 hypothetical protein AC631_05625 [Debaryomyces fabryi]CUM45898.1 unnamed protein product [Debaryomyces fabryi]